MIRAIPSTEPTIADRAFQRSVLALRWLLVGSYIVLAQWGVLEVNTRALVLSGALLVAYNLLHTALVVANPPWALDRRVAALIRHLDIVSITIVLIALHDVRNPVWAVYFITIVGVAHVVTRTEMVEIVVWTCINYITFAIITAANGYEVSWSYVTVVAVLIAFMGLNATILAGGEHRLRELIATVAVTDSLTGLPNRRHFHQSYPETVSEALAGSGQLALMLIDVDHFKEINDLYGHPAGDDKLRDVAAALNAVMRRGDLVARYGGDEFIVVAPRADREAALLLAERLRAAAAECGASVSIGVAICPKDADSEDALVAAADAALYRAKQAGRNCVRAA